MNAATWIAGLWPVAAGAALLVVVGMPELSEPQPPRSSASIEAPLPRGRTRVVPGSHAAVEDQVALWLRGGSGADAFCAKATKLAAVAEVDAESMRSLRVSIHLSDLASGAGDPGPAESFDRRLRSVLGPVSDGRLELELRCHRTTDAPSGPAQRVEWQGSLSCSGTPVGIEFPLWQCPRGKDGIQMLGSTEAALVQGAGPGATGARPVTIGLDLWLRRQR